MDTPKNPDRNTTTFTPATTPAQQTITSQPFGGDAGLRFPEQEGVAYWSYELFGCCDNWQLCLSTFCCPCYTEAKNASYFDEPGVPVAIAYCLGLCSVGPLMRWRIRQHKKLHGGMLADMAVHVLCPCCALIQENRELYGVDGSHLGEKIPINSK